MTDRSPRLLLVQVSAIALAWLSLFHQLIAAEDAPLTAYDKALEHLLEDPEDEARIRSFIDQAIESKRIGDAQTALQHILLVRPNNGRIRLELARLDYRMGLVDRAVERFGAIADWDSIPSDIRRDAGSMQDAIRFRERGHRLSALIGLDGRYETNANAAPEEFRVNGQTVSIENIGEEENDDASLIGLIRLQHDWDPGIKRIDWLETSLFAYGSRYGDVTESNIGLLSLDFGPRARLSHGPSRWWLRPFLKGSAVTLDDTYYRSTLAAGFKTAAKLTEEISGQANLDVQTSNYDENEDNPNADRRDGESAEIQLGLSSSLSTHLSLSSGLRGAVNHAEADFESYWLIGASLDLALSFDNPIDAGLKQPSLRARGAVTRTDYDEPNAAIDANISREDTRYELTLSGDLPVSDGWSFLLSAGFLDNDSNIPNNDYQNWLFTTGARYRFTWVP